MLKISSKLLQLGSRAASQRAMSSISATPIMPQVESKWIDTSESDKQSIINKLDLVMKNDWNAVTLDDKRAIYYINYGNYGVREPSSKKGDSLKILLYTSAIIGASLLTSFGISKLFGSTPHTVTKEWQEASNEYAISQNSNPITGISSKEYKGAGFVHLSKD
ncbi:hypothetical protein BB561_002375 [Smittium simulii]|uniref:Cytochrome c oxidase subunit IV n=1 Tax=Smittium simulii TaxID=133385 RepID=A0A2T9YQS7_9FUNG|nr:hypothetical protein BB561_002375 [Smittium simulii]